MKHTKLKLSVLLLLGFVLGGLHAQEVIPASGGNASGSGGSVSYSVGQLVYTTNTGSNGYSVAEGVQQPYEISVITGLEEAKGINLTCTAYPNPATDLLTLKVENYDYENLSYQLYDMNGNLFESKKLIDKKTSITMAKLVPGTYFLKVISNQKEAKTFKIIKN
jgi:hypothetical protein